MEPEWPSPRTRVQDWPRACRPRLVFLSCGHIEYLDISSSVKMPT